ncbi:MAG: putative bifunctional diguanylate cyclase/phosphodiesterase [Solirubrobacteraceae bacterium]
MLQPQDGRRLAHHDELTGLPSRMQFIEEAAHSIFGGGSAQGTATILLVDLDRFNEINDTLGYPTGDHVLREVAKRLCSQVTDDVLVARLGGDEYAIMSPRASGISSALTLAAAMQSSLEAPVAFDGVAVNVEASIGIAAAAEDVEDLHALLRRADVALALAKARRSGVEVYSPQHDDYDPARLKLLGEVRPALARDEFVLHYQPKIDLDRKRVIGVEALLRWQHPERGLVPPMAFIPLVEQTALIAPLTLRIIDKALCQTALWREQGLRLGVAVNLSVRNLHDASLPGQIDRLLDQHAVPADQLTVEVTESAAMANPEGAARVLNALRATGIGVSIDDFGTGNASIAYLAALPATELKIDMSFITNVCDDVRSDAIVRSIIDLARNLGLKVVAEGIETDATMEHLIRLGCEIGQGYLISRPLPSEDITPRLALALGDAGTRRSGDGEGTLAAA